VSAVVLEPVGPYALRRKVGRILPRAAAAVERHMGERIPETRVHLARPGDFARAVVGTVQGASWLRRATLRAQVRREAASAGGLTLVSEAGPVLVLLDTDSMRDDSTAYAFAVHELVHAVQMGRPGVREDVMRHQRHDLGVERAPRRWLREYETDVARREAEAYRIQELLTKEGR